jgi:putative thioredoxin
MLDLTALQTNAAPAPAASHIYDTHTEGFETDVLAVSMQTPVIVDFWAPWCGPCKQLMPLLEKVVTAAAGAVKMVKVDIDKNPELAQIFRVQSVPTVYAFWQGQPVDGFMGGKPESEIKAFVDKLVKLAGAKPPEKKDKPDTEPMMATADKHLAEGEYMEALAVYSTVLDVEPDNMSAMAGIGWCFVAEKSLEGLAELLSQLTPEQKNDPAVKGLGFLMSQAEDMDVAAPETLQATLDKNPADLAARYDLARAHLAGLNVEAAIAELVELTRRNREWEEQKARKLLLDIFDALGPKHPQTAQGRRQLSAVLFS